MCRQISTERILILFFFERRWSLLYLYLQNSVISLCQRRQNFSLIHWKVLDMLRSSADFQWKFVAFFEWRRVIFMSLRESTKISEMLSKFQLWWLDYNLSHEHQLLLKARVVFSYCSTQQFQRVAWLQLWNKNCKCQCSIASILFSTLHPIPFHCSDILRDLPSTCELSIGECSTWKRGRCVCWW